MQARATDKCTQWLVKPYQSVKRKPSKSVSKIEGFQTNGVMGFLLIMLSFVLYHAREKDSYYFLFFHLLLSPTVYAYDFLACIYSFGVLPSFVAILSLVRAIV